jgi:uncharacterized integral membrane protein (TIGR00698 family)
MRPVGSSPPTAQGASSSGGRRFAAEDCVGATQFDSFAPAHREPGSAPPAAGVGRSVVVIAAGLFCLTRYGSPGAALAIGVLLALTVGNPWPAAVKRITRPLLQVSVVLLGFSMNVFAVLGAARRGFLLAAATIALTFALGAWLRHVLQLKRSTATLLSAGTAICGGSAIAAVGLAITAPEVEMSVAMGTVFVLNAVALYLFPVLGHALGLSQVQFGTWSGIAIHDVSSVVGAASSYGSVALQTATAVKLSRTLWIVPVAVAARFVSRQPRATAAARPVAIPWFIALFLLASVASTFLGPVHVVAPELQLVARTGMTLTLLCIGIGLSRSSLRSVGIRPVLHGLVLWIAISVGSLATLYYWS